MEDDLIRTRLSQLPPGRLADELIDLGNAEALVRDRLELLAAEHDAVALATAVGNRIGSLGQGNEYVSYGRSFGYARELDHIVTTIRERLLPHEPDLAFDLADDFLHADAAVFECVDDSGGAVGEVFKAACTLWLEAASQCRRPRDWETLIHELVANDGYGVRDGVLSNAGILFPEEKLRGMIGGYLAEARRQRREGDRLNHDALSASVNAMQIAVALRDPRLYEEATVTVGGSLNDHQRIDVARKYLEFGDPEGALAKLSEMSKVDGFDRLDLLEECYGKLGRVADQIGILESEFMRTLSKRTFDKILKLRLPEEGESTRRWAHELALNFDTVYTAAIFLFEAGWPDDAERLSLDRAGDLATKCYSRLQDLARLAEAAGRRMVEVVCYRHLIRDILNDGRSKAYGHAVRYFRQLEMLDPQIENYASLGDHDAFVAELRKHHGRKSAFWGRLEPGRKR